MSDDGPVLVVGAGPVGMSLAVELGSRGVAVTLLERRQESTPFPGLVNLTNPRTMEHFRRWGIAAGLRGNSILPADVRPAMTFATRLNGHVVLDLDGALAFPEAPPFAAEAPLWGPLRAIDRALREKIEQLEGVEIRWGTAATGLTVDDDGVRVEAEGPDGAVVLEGPYLAIAEGSAGTLRASLNVRLEDLGPGPEACAWHFRAPELASLFAAGPSAATFFVNEDRRPGGLMPQGPDGEWLYVLAPCPPDVDGDDWEAVRSLLVASVGAEFEATPIEGGLRGRSFGLVPRADLGRVFLLGDSAQAIPVPGWGMNVGIGDAVDLGWKLAATIAGWGGPTLSAAYGIERGEAKRTLLEGLANASFTPLDDVIQSGLEDGGEDGERARAATAGAIAGEFLAELATAGGELGLRYDASPLVVIDDEDEPPPFELAEFRPENRPGARAPHLLLEDGSALYDRLGPGFALIVLGDVAVEPFEVAAGELGIPFAVQPLDASLGAAAGYATAMTLIRPDQHVAWRGEEVPADPRRVLELATGALAGA